MNLVRIDICGRKASSSFRLVRTVVIIGIVAYLGAAISLAQTNVASLDFDVPDRSMHGWHQKVPLIEEVTSPHSTPSLHARVMNAWNAQNRAMGGGITALPGSAGSWEQRLALIQGGYYAATGLWPIVHMRSFEKVTGPKTDDWLVKTVGALITVVGGTLLIAGLRDGPSDDLKMIAVGSAAALTIVDVTYVARGRISSIYLLDAALEVPLIVGWTLTF